MAKEGLPSNGIKAVMNAWSDANERVLNYRKEQKKTTQPKKTTGRKK